MQIFKEKEALKKLIRSFKNEDQSIGFVPTMGALHHGHLSLVSRALVDCDKVVVSIFVNPTQFDNASDLQKYPRTLESDVLQLASLNEEVLIFAPNPAEIYGSEIVSEHFSFDGLEHHMEGKFRQGHFDGVGTVVKKLLEIVEPHKAFFGEKDYQQLQIIRKLVEKQGIGTEIIGCPIDREDTGLARSSRNERLSQEQRQNARFIYQVLTEVKNGFGTKSASDIADWVEKEFTDHPFLKLEYFEIADANTLSSIQEKEEGMKYRAFIAAYSGEIRLIDNIALN